jgi:hypothetical protein
LYASEIVTDVETRTPDVMKVKVALLAPAGVVTSDGTLPAVVLPLESMACAPPAWAGAFSVTMPVEERPPRSSGSRSARVVEVEDYRSKLNTAGFGSLNETTTNFDREITYTTALPPDPEVTTMVPLPFVGDGDMEYVALTVTPELGPRLRPVAVSDEYEHDDPNSE